MKHKRFIALVVVGLAALSLLALVPMYGMTHFTGVGIHQPTAVGTATPALLVDNDGVSNVVEFRDGGTPVWYIAADGSINSSGSQAQSDGDVVVADDLRITPQTSITVTNGAAFTATGTYQGIIAAGEVTPTITAGTAGDLLVLINTGTQTINIADTGTQMLSAAWAAGQYDTLTLICDGTNWLEVSRSGN
jgi:hypothetical protein